MNTAVQALKEELEQLKQQCRQAESRYHHAERRFRVLGGLALVAVMGAILVSPANRAALAQGYGVTLKQLLNRVKALETKTQFVSIGGDGEMHIVGTNLHIENGLGATNGEPADPFDTNNPVVNGKGNLIIGYNALRGGGFDVRSGSHNLILGDFNNYSSYGGLVVGSQNTISGPYASVSGGFGNTASGELSSVSGGQDNTASGGASCVSGGEFNTASGVISCVSGGEGNTASGDVSFVSGGEGNTASGELSSVSGGSENTASGFASSVSGGEFNTASGFASSVGGGRLNIASGDFSAVSGGRNLAMVAKYGWAAGSEGSTNYFGNFESP